MVTVWAVHVAVVQVVEVALVDDGDVAATRSVDVVVAAVVNVVLVGHQFTVRQARGAARPRANGNHSQRLTARPGGARESPS